MQEPDRVPARRLALVTVVAIAVGVSAVVVAAFIGRVNGALPRRAFAAAPPRGTVETSLVSTGGGRGDEARARQRALLDEYGWVDRDAGIARIPIDRAMDLVLEERR